MRIRKALNSLGGNVKSSVKQYQIREETLQS